MPALAAYHLTGWVPGLEPRELARALAGLALGACAADLVTGAVHWACDSWGDEHTRWVGPGLIHSFREHHVRPLAMLDHDWIEVNGEPAAAASAAFGLLALPVAREWSAEHVLASAFAWSLVSVASLANQVHKWAHGRHRAPRLVRRLQRAGWILSPARHARHHRSPHATDYCITGGWLNPALDGVGFWRALERAITRLTGAAPRRESLSSGSYARRNEDRTR
jgi:ubiquitin-conjugating enzyme E2 variant